MSSDKVRGHPRRVKIEIDADWGHATRIRLALEAAERGSLAAIIHADALAAALRALVEHYDRFFVAVLGEELHAKTGDPAELAEGRRVLAALDAKEPR